MQRLRPASAPGVYKELGFDRKQQRSAAQRATIAFLFRLPFAPPLALPSLYICAFIPLNYIVSALHASLRASLRTSLYISLRRIASRPVATLTRPSPPWLEAKAKVVKIHTKLHNTQRPARHIDKLQRYTSSKPETWVGILGLFSLAYRQPNLSTRSNSMRGYAKRGAKRPRSYNSKI